MARLTDQERKTAYQMYNDGVWEKNICKRYRLSSAELFKELISMKL